MEGLQQLVVEGAKTGFIVNESQTDNVSPLELCEKLGKLDFWCGNETIHQEKPDTYTDEWCCLTHVVGLPRHPATNEEMPLTPFQVEFVKEVIRATTNPGSMSESDWKRLHHMFHVLKGRQMGFTEIVLRIIQYFCFNRYAGRNVGIIAATSGELAYKDLRRFYRLFVNIPSVRGVRTTKIFTIVNGTVIQAFPASEEALTGDTKYACIYMDESAKWKLIDDTPVFNSVMPIVRSNGADLFLVSTGKGPIKMFYRIFKNRPKEFVMLKYNIWRSEGNLYTTAQIEEMIASSEEDPDQEYMCKFTIGRDSILGAITDADRKDDLFEWGQKPDDEEGDGYKEPKDGLEDEWPD